MNNHEKGEKKYSQSKKILEEKNKTKCWHSLWVKEIGVILPLNILSFQIIVK